MTLTNVFYKPIPWHLMKFPPDEAPQTLPPPQSQPGWLTPFNIDAKLYNDMLSVYWPVTIATVYATTVVALNRVNKSRGNKPWGFSRTGAFTAFVLAHNIFLTVYSGWTFIGMLGGMTRTFSGILDNSSQYGLAPVVDALCKMTGPRGIGEAATFDPSAERWTVKDQAIKLLNGNPDPTDVGRLWNEGLAFYGWIFYLSKFYEVLDTVIILAKGKRSSTLQTYHHAGAMMCMWAGIRYMSPPIWMFVQFNSGIHTLMYFYYTLAALGVKVPNRIKKSLTTLQITQFIIGASFAFAHLIVAYQVPANTPYIFSHGVASAASAAASSVASALPTATSAIEAGWGPWVKKALLRAVGDEGLAENVKGPSGGRFGLDALNAEISDHNRQEIRYRMEYPEVHCLDTSGQAFAIWLNVLYLLPLTFLFGRFFVKSYLRRAQGQKQTPPLHQRLVRSGSDAAKGVDREIRQAMGDKQGYNSPIDDQFAIELEEEIAKVKKDIKAGAAAIKEEGEWLATRIQEKAKPVVNGAAKKVKEVKQEIKEESKPAVSKAQAKATEVTQNAKGKVSQAASGAQNKAQDVVAQVKEDAPKTTDAVGKKANNVATTFENDASNFAKAATNKAGEAAQKTEQKATETASATKDAVSGASKVIQGKADDAAAQAKDYASKTAEDAKEQGDTAGKEVKSQFNEAAGKVKDAADQATESAKQEASNVTGSDIDGHEAQVKPGETYADAVKQDPEEVEHDRLDSMEESAVEVTREDFAHGVGEQSLADTDGEGTASGSSLFG